MKNPLGFSPPNTTYRLGVTEFNCKSLTYVDGSNATFQLIRGHERLIHREQGSRVEEIGPYWRKFR